MVGTAAAEVAGSTVGLVVSHGVGVAAVASFGGVLILLADFLGFGSGAAAASALDIVLAVFDRVVLDPSTSIVVVSFSLAPPVRRFRSVSAVIFETTRCALDRIDFSITFAETAGVLFVSVLPFTGAADSDGRPERVERVGVVVSSAAAASSASLLVCAAAFLRCTTAVVLDGVGGEATLAVPVGSCVVEVTVLRIAPVVDGVFDGTADFAVVESGDDVF